MSTYGKLSAVEDLEGLMSEIYAKYSRLFSGDAEASKLFAGLSSEEKTHMQVISHVRMAFLKDPSCLGSIDVDMDEVDEILVNVTEAIGSDKGISLQEALNFALKMEVRCAELSNIFSVAESKKQGTFLNIYLEDQEHYTKLREFALARSIGH